MRADGSPSLCAVCGSRMHWAKKCPHAYERTAAPVCYSSGKNASGYDEEVQITLMASDTVDMAKLDNLLGETLGSVLLESGCTKTVCGSQWLQCYLDTQSDKEKALIKYESSSSVFCFGDGDHKTAIKCALIPCVLVDKKIQIRTRVVNCNVPLLLSRESMKMAGMVIDLTSDTVEIFNQRIKLGITSMGHYTLPIYRIPTTEKIEHVLLSEMSNGNTDAVARKLHRQFAHPSVDKLQKLLKDAF